MRLFGYLFRKKSALLFYDARSVTRTLVNLLCILLALIYGVGYAALLQSPVFSAQQKLVIADVCLGFVCVIIVLRRIFPVYTEFRFVLPEYMPGGVWKRIGLQVMSDGLNLLGFCVVLFYLTVFICGGMNGARLLASIGLVVAAGVLETGIKMFLTPRRSAEAAESAGTWSVMGLYRLSFKVLFRNRPSTVALIVAYVFKALILTISGFAILKKPHYAQSVEFNWVMMVLLFSPILPFNYLFNNLWGYLTPMWLVLSAGSGWKRRATVYLRLAMTVVLPDVLISLAFLSIARLAIYSYLLFYLICLLLFLPAGVSISILAPRRIRKAVAFGSMKSNSSFVGSFVSIGLGLASYFLIVREVAGRGWAGPAICLGGATLLTWLAVYLLRGSIKDCYKKLY